MQVVPEAQELEPGLTSLVFPVYNAAAILPDTWRQVEAFLDAAPGNWEVLFVCDGCGASEAALRALTRGAGARVRVLGYERNRGKGHAVRFGLQAARGQWRLFTDVDLAYSTGDVLRLAEQLWAGAEVAIASRHHPDSRLVLPPRLQGYCYRRHLQSLLFARLVRWLLPLALPDTQAGLKGLTGRAAAQLLPHLRCRGFGFDCELLTACVRFGLTITEVPVHVRYETRSTTTTLRSTGRMVRELWKIRRRWRRFVRPEPTPVGTGPASPAAGGGQAAPRATQQEQPLCKANAIW
jgi:dolichyl-phosphate beta-glucosyltransferase